jgi:hypothetical protein
MGPGEGYVLCIGDSGVQKRMTSVEHLRAVTPIISGDDPVLRYSCKALAELATQQCPFWWVNCSELPDRLSMMEQTDGCCSVAE